VAVTGNGNLWVWGCGKYGQLGLDDRNGRQVPTLNTLVQTKVKSFILSAACGGHHTMAIAEDGSLWGFGLCQEGIRYEGKMSILPDLVLSTTIALHIVSTAQGRFHSSQKMFVTNLWHAYVWGKQTKHSVGIGHNVWPHVAVCIDPQLVQGVRFGRCHDLPPLRALAFAMGTHSRLGSDVPTPLDDGLSFEESALFSFIFDQKGHDEIYSTEWAWGKRNGEGDRAQDRDVIADADGGRRGSGAGEGARGGKSCLYLTLPCELVQQLAQACASWPEGRAGELEGVVQLLGGGRRGPMASTR